MLTYELYLPIGWHHHGRNGIIFLVMTWIFRHASTGLYMRLIILLAGTIMVAMGLTLYHGIYTTWIFCCDIYKIQIIYEIYRPIG
jgi:hypothetical protein